jgi:Protein of unknown function (DUF2852)
MLKLHTIALLSSGVLLGAFVGYALAHRYRFAHSSDPRGPVGSGAFSGLVKRVSSWFDRRQTGAARPTGNTDNQAFQAYKNETLERLYNEQRQFEEFVNGLRYAKDKAEFDTFLASKSGKQQATKPTQGI